MVDVLAELRAALDVHRLKVRGVVDPAPGELLPARELAHAGTLVLVGNVGSSMWAQFAASPEYRDSIPDPLDRWSRRIGLELARRFDALALFPFGGPPHHPFQRWAVRAGTIASSPLGLLIDHEFGLWHAYRFALVLPRHLPLTQTPLAVDSPCATCTGEPCLHTCPVGAFSVGEYHVDRCVGHLSGALGEACMGHGCMARLACPMGQASRYRADHARFHMESFVKARPALR